MTLSPAYSIRMASRWARLLGALALAVVGCSDLGSNGTGGQGGAAAAGGSTGVGGEGGASGSGGVVDPGGTVPLLFTTADWTTGNVLEGVEICEADADPENCVLTDAEGLAVLDLPVDQEVTLTLEKAGYGPLLGADVTDETFTGESADYLYSHAVLEEIAEQLGVEYPWQGGVVRFARLHESRPGVTFEPVGETVGAVGDPFYLNGATGRYSWELDATTGAAAAWFLPLGEGGFVEVPAGVQEFELGGTSGDCAEPSWGWPGSGPNRIRLPVRDGYIVYGSLRCQ